MLASLFVLVLIVCIVGVTDIGICVAILIAIGMCVDTCVGIGIAIWVGS